MSISRRIPGPATQSIDQIYCQKTESGDEQHDYGSVKDYDLDQLFSPDDVEFQHKLDNLLQLQSEEMASPPSPQDDVSLNLALDNLLEQMDPTISSTEKPEESIPLTPPRQTQHFALTPEQSDSGHQTTE